MPQGSLLQPGAALTHTEDEDVDQLERTTLTHSWASYELVLRLYLMHNCWIDIFQAFLVTLLLAL